MEKQVTVPTYDFPGKAQVLKLLLEEQGLDVFLIDDNLVGTNLFLSNAVGGAKLQVRESDVETALQFVEADRQSSRHADKPLNKPDVKFDCEECGETISFAANRRGGVETCPFCRKYVDVPE